jgi:hypothetical protein
MPLLFHNSPFPHLPSFPFKKDFGMTVFNTNQLEFSTCKSRKVKDQFNGGNMTSDGGIMLLGQVDENLKTAFSPMSS